MIIPTTHCQSCASLISLFTTAPTLCTNCTIISAELDHNDAQNHLNDLRDPECRDYTELEKRNLRKVVQDTANNDVRAAYSFIRRMRDSVLAVEEYTKAAFLRELRIEILTGEAS